MAPGLRVVVLERDDTGQELHDASLRVLLSEDGHRAALPSDDSLGEAAAAEREPGGLRPWRLRPIGSPARSRAGSLRWRLRRTRYQRR